jgi:hypothetical protein
MNGLKRSAEAFVCGVAITLITGAFNTTPGGLVGATWYGFPVTWLSRLVIAPQYFPWRVNWVGFIADVIVWMILVWIVSFVLSLGTYTKMAQDAKKKSSKPKGKKSKR